MRPSTPRPEIGKGAGKGAPRPEVRPTKNWREVRKESPERAREIFVATKLAGRAHDVSVRVATGLIGGVYPGDYRGGGAFTDSWVCDPWGWSRWSCGWSWGSSWCWWSYPLFWSCYYPCWWWYSRPYYYADYCYYPVTTVVYGEPSVIYLERESAPAGESGAGAVSGDQVAAPAAPPAASPLSIAAQRYLELGDRAFREGRYTDAVQFYAKAVEFAPDQGALYLVLADALFASGDYHYAAYAVRRALELDPALVDTKVDKHGFYPDPKVFDQHLAALERYLDDHPGDRDARLVLALNYLFGGRAPEAVRALENPAAGLADDPAGSRILARARAGN